MGHTGLSIFEGTLLSTNIEPTLEGPFGPIQRKSVHSETSGSMATTGGYPFTGREATDGTQEPELALFVRTEAATAAPEFEWPGMGLEPWRRSHEKGGEWHLLKSRGVCLLFRASSFFCAA